MTNADRFEAFVREYEDLVYATALRLLGSAADAEDVSQTVFLRAFERFAQIGSSETAAGWLKTVATNVCLNHLSRYRARWRLFSEMDRDDGEGGEAAFEDTVAAGGASAVAGMVVAERREQLEHAVQQLPDHQRVPLVLFHFEQKSYQEIATMLGVSLAKVKTDIHRAREGLRRRLTET